MVDEQAETTVTIVINVDILTGNLSMQGPLDNPMMFVGILEMAKIALIEKRAKDAKSPMILPPPLDLSTLHRH